SPRLYAHTRARRNGERAIPLCTLSVGHPEQNAKCGLLFSRRNTRRKGADIVAQVSSGWQKPGDERKAAEQENQTQEARHGNLLRRNGYLFNHPAFSSQC